MTETIVLLAVAVLSYSAGLSYETFKKMTHQEKLQGASVMAFMFVLIVVEGLLN